MTRTELSQKICEGIFAVFGRPSQDPENWLYEQDYARGHVTITEQALGSRDAMGICRRLEEAIGCGVHVSATLRAAEAYSFTIAFDSAKNEGKYSDGKKTLSTIEQDGKTVITDGTPEGTIAVTDPDKFVDNLNKVTGSRFRKAEELLDERAAEANLALEGTGYSMAREEKLIRVSGPKAEALAALCKFIPEGDEYFGSGMECGDGDCFVLVLPSEIFGVEELLNFIDNVAYSLIEASSAPKEKTDAEWSDAISAAQPDPAMARRLSFMKEPGGLSLALSDEKFAQAVASVRDVYGDDKAEALMTVRLGARMARAIIEKLGPMSPAAKTESFVGAPSKKGSRVAAIIDRHMISSK